MIFSDIDVCKKIPAEYCDVFKKTTIISRPATQAKANYPALSTLISDGIKRLLDGTQSLITGIQSLDKSVNTLMGFKSSTEDSNLSGGSTSGTTLKRSPTNVAPQFIGMVAVISLTIGGIVLYKKWTAREQMRAEQEPQNVQASKRGFSKIGSNDGIHQTTAMKMSSRRGSLVLHGRLPTEEPELEQVFVGQDPSSSLLGNGPSKVAI